MSKPDDLDWLMQWYLSQCDEDWEHQFGVTIDTLDNPGWSLSVDLDGTILEGLAFLPVYEGVSEPEQSVQGLDGDVPWLVCRVEGPKFKGWCGPRDLGRLISTFRVWVEAVN
ncbi:hypothetical protein V474_21955 [Novosphingobium barchaimii LL02]|uniref:Rhodanese-related sulfurtransferase n=1 Tax=Novosphingobium barchaimii LL02 TaxID=1114963 RepID=A0A0J7XRW2_9SPHN|nr:immunity 53 family protein [Novosphingobium barchaimii]KMS54394.1 hypothetical protein V474_21955 [Novosphingobium barchaimii LL02]